MDNASFFVVIVGFFAGVAISSSLSSRFALSDEVILFAGGERSLGIHPFCGHRTICHQPITDTAHSKRSNVWPLPRCDLKVFVQPIKAAGPPRRFLELAYQHTY